MTVLIVVETLLLVLLSVLVAGLLRSHAEILRRLNQIDERAPGGSAVGAERARAEAALPHPRIEATPASDVAGQTLEGDPIHLGVRGTGTNTLLAFLSSGCLSCRTLWDGLEPRVRPRMPGGARLVVVTKGPDQESPRKLRGLAPKDVPVVMSSEAWEAYGVPASPYFIFVDGPSGEVHGEGAASQWSQVISLLNDALADQDQAAWEPPDTSSNGRGRPLRPATAPRLARVDADLLSAGIGPDHPSLYGPGPDVDEREEASRT
jgi:hypothetical protein